MLQDDYTVRLQNFQGPLDLLLYLVRRAEVDVTEISLAALTDQYVRFLDDIDRVDVEVAGEFLVIAATLLELKSRHLSADAEEQADDKDDDRSADPLSDPGMDLIRNLLEYKTYRDASDALDDRRREWEQQFPSGRAAVPEEALDDLSRKYADLEMDELEVFDLVEAFQRIVETVQFDRLGEHEVQYDDTPIELHQADIVDQLNRIAPAHAARGTQLRAIFEGRKRTEMIGLFLALLELVRQRVVAVTADESADDIRLRLRPEEEREPPPGVVAKDDVWDDDHIFDEDDEDDDGEIDDA